MGKTAAADRPTVAELARLEAERAEAETETAGADSGEQGGAEAETEAAGADSGEQPAETETEQPAEAAGAELERELEHETRRHEAALAQMFGLEPPLTACPICDEKGYLPPGFGQLRQSDRYATCGHCGGMGDVLTGSLKEGEQLQTCHGCGGRGFLDRLDQPAQPPLAAAAGPGAPQPPPAGAEYGAPGWLGDTGIRPVLTQP